LLPVDTHKLGRFWAIGKRIREDGVHRSPQAGWQYLHIALDDHTRLAYAEVLPTERTHDCAAFLPPAVAWYKERGIRIERLLSDNANAYHAHAWRDTCTKLKTRRRHTRPYPPSRLSNPCGQYT
jgi:hypothetical protein